MSKRKLFIIVLLFVLGTLISIHETVGIGRFMDEQIPGPYYIGYVDRFFGLNPKIALKDQPFLLRIRNVFK